MLVGAGHTFNSCFLGHWVPDYGILRAVRALVWLSSQPGPFAASLWAPGCRGLFGSMCQWPDCTLGHGGCSWCVLRVVCGTCPHPLPIKSGICPGTPESTSYKVALLHSN